LKKVSSRIESLRKGEDTTLELSKKELVSVIKTENTNSKGLTFTSNTHEIEGCNYYIVTVPTPVDKNKKPEKKLVVWCLIKIFLWAIRQSVLTQEIKNIR